MLHIDFPYIFVNIFLLLTMWYAGYKISRGHGYWFYAIVVIIAFTIVEGIRYGRGVDYMHYLQVIKYNLEETQVIFSFFNQMLKRIGIPTEYFFMFYAFFFITGAMIFLKPMKKYAMYIFPFFLISIISLHEAFIRQFLAMSFIFVYVFVLNRILTRNISKKNIFLLIFLFVIAESIHSISGVTLFAITLIFIFFKKPFPWQLTIPTLLIGKFCLGTFFDWNYLNSFLGFLSTTDEKFAMYVENSDRWFSSAAINVKYTRNIIIQFLEIFACSSVFYLGNKVCKLLNGMQLSSTKRYLSATLNHIYTVFFNIFVLGYLVLESFYNFEIVRRVAYGWSIYWFIPVSLLLYYKNNHIFTKKDRFLMLSILFWGWEYYRFLFIWSQRPLFLWDI